jgi:hypothetical protein
MKYRVIVVHRAQRDVSQNYDWIAVRSQRGADAWFSAFESMLKRPEQNPRLYGLAPESDDATAEIREFAFRTRRGLVYRGLFTISGDEVRVLHIRGPGQRPLRPDELVE